jgi:hypothetical protein
MTARFARMTSAARSMTPLRGMTPSHFVIEAA